MEIKPRFYWTEEKCFEEALKYKNKTDFHINSITAYNRLRKNNCLEKACEHMIDSNKPDNFWTKEKCQEESLKYNTKKQFREANNSCYNYSYKKGWLNEICLHMIELQKPSGYWDQEKCQEEALKYNTKKEFIEKNNSCYLISRRKGWLDGICSHMVVLQNPKGYWDQEKCQEEALKYKSKTEFSQNSSTPYTNSLKFGWLDEICLHMETFGNRIKRCIYVYEFLDNSAYIGLTYNINNRHNRHIKKQNSIVYKKINNGIKYELKQLSDYINITETIKLEEYYVNEYKNNGWNVLNKNKTGGLGGNVIKWTKEKCQEEALKYNSRSELQHKGGSVYSISLRNNWLDEICSHMIELQKPSGYWTKEKCQEEALKYNSRSEFQHKSGSAHCSSSKNNWLNEICSHMKLSRKPSGYWTKEKCQEEALKYNTKMELKKNEVSAYNVIYKQKWNKELFSHMVETKK